MKSYWQYNYLISENFGGGNYGRGNYGGGNYGHGNYGRGNIGHFLKFTIIKTEI